MELNEVQHKFGARLCRAMEAKGLSQSKLSGLSKISKTHLRQIMDGECNTSLDSIRRLAIACEVEPKFFFDWE